jgi:hypothetical protein
MNEQIYKVIHFVGIFMIFLSLGGIMVHMINGGTKAGNKWRVSAALTHGLGLFLVLLGGFGMLARYGKMGEAAKEMYSITAPWMIGKLIIWVIFGGVLMLVYRAPGMNKVLWWVLIILGGIAACLGIFKPGAVAG